MRSLGIWASPFPLRFHGSSVSIFNFLQTRIGFSPILNSIRPGVGEWAKEGPGMKKLCPDLVALDDAALVAFWETHKVNQLKRLGDRLLAESLPRFEARDSKFYPTDLSTRRQGLNLSLSDTALRLGVNPVVLAAWESGEVRPPASLGLIYTQGL